MAGAAFVNLLMYYSPHVLDHLQMETRLASERADKEREISIREEKLSKLKKQIAEALKGNSW